MPLRTSACLFHSKTIMLANECGAVYGLFGPGDDAGQLRCLYVGETNNLRQRLTEHYREPPCAEIVYFIAEEVADDRQRAVRLRQLLAEYDPPGNKRVRRSAASGSH